MKALSIILIISAIVMGYFDGGNITEALVLSILFASVIF